jgi:hypothetical protein
MDMDMPGYGLLFMLSLEWMDFVRVCLLGSEEE